ncbi:unnamed protein product [Microthlaspi erraticum]|uniref:Uncharacterized protein n=1 Tax=Microthlaspi erraticum TaxID=1685480 RepID=A0A6D2K2E1_9BRAS|nr:unnamed protein product [Microthlaspi erraticum]
MEKRACSALGTWGAHPPLALPQPLPLAHLGSPLVIFINQLVHLFSFLFTLSFLTPSSFGEPFPPLEQGVCELDRVGLQGLGRARLTTGRKRVQRSQRVQEEPEVLVADTMDVPEGNGNPLGMDSVELGKLDRLVKEMLQTATNRDKGLFHHQCRTTTLRSSWE